MDAAFLELALDGVQLSQPLLHRCRRREPPEALAGLDQALVAQGLQGAADRDPADAELCGQIALAGQHMAGADRSDSLAEHLGDLLVADRAHVSRGLPRVASLVLCLSTSDTKCKARGSHDRHRRNADRTGRRRVRHADARSRGRARPLRSPAHAHREDPAQPPRRSDRSRSSAAAPTTTSTPTGWRCRTPPRRWRCCSS